jgi:hypothetical protein
VFLAIEDQPTTSREMFVPVMEQPDVSSEMFVAVKEQPSASSKVLVAVESPSKFIGQKSLFQFGWEISPQKSTNPAATVTDNTKHNKEAIRASARACLTKLNAQASTAGMVDPGAMGQGWSVKSTHGRPTGRTRGMQAGFKRNIREPGAPVLRRDMTATVKLHIINQVDKRCILESCDIQNFPATAKREFEKRYALTWKFIGSLMAKRLQLQAFVVSHRHGIAGLRPFGSRETTSNKKVSQGARLPNPNADLSLRQPLHQVFVRIKKWLTKERMYGHEIRGTTMRTRFKLELLAEKGKQQVFQELLSPQYNARVQTAVEHRLMRMSEVGFARSKRFKEFERNTFFPAVGALARKPEKQSHLDEKLEEPLAQLTWRGIDRALWMVLNASYEDLGKFVDNPETFQDNAKTMPIVAFDQTPLWLKLRGEEKS